MAQNPPPKPWPSSYAHLLQAMGRNQLMVVMPHAITEFVDDAGERRVYYGEPRLLPDGSWGVQPIVDVRVSQPVGFRTELACVEQIDFDGGHGEWGAIPWATMPWMWAWAWGQTNRMPEHPMGEPRRRAWEPPR